MYSKPGKQPEGALHQHALQFSEILFHSPFTITNALIDATEFIPGELMDCRSEDDLCVFQMEVV
jgi:hypothetical protein